MTESRGEGAGHGVRSRLAGLTSVARRHALRAGVQSLQSGAILVVTWIFLIDPGMNVFFASKFEDAVHGRSFQPYVYRALVPWLVGSVTGLLESFRYHVALFFHQSVLLGELTARSRVPVTKSLELGIFAVVVVVLLHVFAASLRRTAQRLYAAPPPFAEVVTLGALVLLPSLFSYHNYVYDPGTLVFSALALEALVAARWVWFVLLVAAGYFNKETIVLFVPLFALHAYGKVPAKRYYAMLAALIVAFVVSRVVLNALFASYLGEYTISQLLSHNLKLIRVYPVATVVAWIAVGMAIFGHWTAKPRVLKLGLLCHLPLFGACLLWGFFDELRDYYETYPMLVLMMAPTLAAAMGVEVRPASS